MGSTERAYGESDATLSCGMRARELAVPARPCGATRTAVPRALRLARVGTEVDLRRD